MQTELSNYINKHKALFRKPTEEERLESDQSIQQDYEKTQAHQKEFMTAYKMKQEELNDTD